MAARAQSSLSPRWQTVGNLAEYAYCPRAYAYRTGRHASDPDPESVARQDYGTMAHHQHLTAALRAEASSRWLAVAIAVAALVMAGALAVALGA
jgi:hypothetical protein